MPLALAIALHAALLLALLNGLQPHTVDLVTPREVVVSLIANRAPTLVEPHSVRTPEPVARPAPTPMPTPMPMPMPKPAVTSVATPSPAPQPVAAPVPTSLPVQRNTITDVPAPAASTAPLAVPPAPVAESRPAPTHAANPAPPAPAERGPVTVSHVEYLQAPKPDYPLSAKRAGEQGKVLLRVLVDEKGRPERVDVRESAGFARLDEAARQAVLRASFKPHVEDGRAVPVYVMVPISFALR